MSTRKWSPCQTFTSGSRVGAIGSAKGPLRNSLLGLIEVITISASGPIQMAASRSAKSVASIFGAAYRRRTSVRPEGAARAGLDIEGAPENLAEEHTRDSDRQHEDGDADGRTIAEARVPEALEIDEVTQNVGAPEWRSLLHHRDEIECLQRLKERPDGDPGGYGTKVRQRDAQHHAQMPGALDPSRVERLLGHVADPGEIKDHRQSSERPPAHDRERVDGDAIVAEPFTDQKPEAESAQYAVEGAKNRVQDQEEHQSHRDERHRHWKKYGSPQKGGKIDRARTHRVGNEKSENDREGQRDREPLQIVFKRDIEIFVAEHVAIVGESDELFDRRHAVPFEEAQIDRVEDRIADKAEEKDDRQDQSENCDEDVLAREGDEGRSFVAHPRSHCDVPSGKRGALASKPLLAFHADLLTRLLIKDRRTRARAVPSGSGQAQPKFRNCARAV